MATDFLYLLLDGHVIDRPDQSLMIINGHENLHLAIRITTDMKYGVDPENDEKQLQ